LFGWRAVIWNRGLIDNCWRKGCEVHVDDIMVENPHHSALMAQLGDDAVGNSTIMNLLPSFPTLGVYGDDVVHMSSRVRSSDIENMRMVAVDMRKKALKTLAPSHVLDVDDYCSYFPCVLSSYLSNTPIHAQTPEQSLSYYYGRPHEYANCTYPSYDNYLQPLAVSLQWQQQQTFQPNCPIYPVLVHPNSMNDCRLHQPPLPWAPMPPLPFVGMLPLIPPAAAVNPAPRNRHRSPHRHSPYGRPRRNL
jgi:hypothetical protein